MKHLNFKYDYSATDDVCSLDDLSVKATVKKKYSALGAHHYCTLHVTQKMENQPRKSFQFKQHFRNTKAAMIFFMDSMYESAADTPIDLEALRADLRFFKLSHVDTQQMKLACKQFLLLADSLTNTRLFDLQLGSLPWCLAVFRDEGMSQSQCLAFIRIVQAARSFLATGGELDCVGFMESISGCITVLLSPTQVSCNDCKTLITKDGAEWRSSKNEYDPFHSPTWNIKGCKYIRLDSVHWLKETFLTGASSLSLKSFNRQTSTSLEAPLNFGHNLLRVADRPGAAFTAEEMQAAYAQGNAPYQPPVRQPGESRKAVNVRPAGMTDDMFAALSGNYPEPNPGKVQENGRSWYSTDIQSGIVEINDPNNRGEKALIIPGERVTKGVTVTPSWYVLCIFPAEGGDAIFRFARDVADALQTYDKLRPAPTKQETKQPEQPKTSPNTLRDAIVDNARILLRLLTAPVSYTVITMSNTRFQNATNLILMSQTRATLSEPIGWSYIATYCGDDFKSLLGAAFHWCDVIASDEANYRDLIPHLVQYLNRLTTENFKD